MGSNLDVRCATPVGSSEAVPSVVAPLVYVTVPVGTAPPEPEVAVAVAISSTGKPCVEEVAEVVRAKALGEVGTETVSVAAADVDAW
jgi:hypothetical protein